MTYLLTASDAVVRVADGATIPNDPENTDRAAYTAWVADGGIPDPAPVQPVTVATYQRAIDAHVEATAAQRGYSTGTSCASYAASTVPAWAAEAAAFIAWRDAVWIATYAGLASVQAGDPAPDVEPFLASLPLMVWPA